MSRRKRVSLRLNARDIGLNLSDIGLNPVLAADCGSLFARAQIRSPVGHSLPTSGGSSPRPTSISAV